MTNNLHVYTEFDPDPSSIIDPTVIFPEESDFPKIFVSCFARTQFDRLKSYLGNAVAFGSSKSANLETPYYLRKIHGPVRSGLLHAGWEDPGKRDLPGTDRPKGRVRSLLPERTCRGGKTGKDGVN